MVILEHARSQGYTGDRENAGEGIWGYLMGIMTNRNTCGGKATLFIAILAILVVFQPGLAENRGIEQFRQAAEQGDVETQSALGVMLRSGIGVPKDHKEATKWFRKAAEQGHAEAQLRLGSMFQSGIGVPEDDREAVKWYRKAAEQGHAWAQIRLSSMYASGEGVHQDYKEAEKWFRKAAEAQRRTTDLWKRIESSLSK